MSVRLIFPLAMVFFSASTSYAQINTTWQGTTNGNWNSSGRWTPNTFPNNSGANTYNAIIGTGATVTVNQPITVTGLDFSQGVIRNTGTTNLLTVLSGLNWTGGEFIGSGQVHIGGGTIGGADTTNWLTLGANKQFRIIGNTTWQGDFIGNSDASLGTMFVENASTLNITGTQGKYSSNNFSLASGSTLNHNSTGQTNFGGNTYVGDGAVNVNSGILALNAGTSIAQTGSFQVGGAGTAEIQGADATFSGNVSGAGNLNIYSNALFNSSSNYTLANTHFLSGEATFNTGNVVNFGNNSDVTSGYVGGSDDLVFGTSNWTGGGFIGAGNVTLNGGTIGVADSLSTLIVDQRTVKIGGNVDWQGDNISYFSEIGKIEVLNGATLNSNSANAQGGVVDVMVNSGGTWKTTSGDQVSIQGNSFVNNGNVQVDTGRLTLSSMIGGTGDWLVNSGAVLELAHDSVLTGNVTGAGAVAWTGGTNFMNGPTYSVGKSIFANTGVEFNTGGTVDFGSNSELLGGYVGGTDDLVFGTSNWTGGGFIGAGNVTLNGGTIGVADSLSTLIVDQRTVKIGGNVDWQGDNISYFSEIGKIEVLNGATLNSNSANAQGGVVDVMVNSGGTWKTTSGDQVSIQGNSFVNNGNVQVDTGRLTLSSMIGGTGDWLVNSGAVLDFGNDLNLNGNVTGAGTVEWTGGTNFMNGSTYSVGKSIFGANVEFNTGGTVDFGSNSELLGGSVGGSSDLLFGSAKWESGGFFGVGTTRINGGTMGMTNAGGNSLILDGRNIQIGGNVNWRGDSVATITGIGSFDILNGGTLHSSSTNTQLANADMVISAGGTLRKTGGVVAFTGSSFTNNGTIQVNSGAVEIALQSDGGFTNYNETTKTLTGGKYDLAGRLSMFQVGNAFVDNNAADITLRGTSARFTTNTNSASVLGNLKNNTSAGSLSLRNGALLTDNSSLNNSGIINIGAGSKLTLAGTSSIRGVYTQLAGITDLENGGFLQAARDINFIDGVLSGSGDLDIVSTTASADFGFASTIAPGQSAGIINIFADMSIQGTLDFELAGLLVDGLAQDINSVNYGSNFLITEFDQLNVFGDLTLDSTSVLDLSLIDGFTPMSGDFFDLLTGDSITLMPGFAFNGPSGYNFSFELLSLNDPANGNVTRDVFRVTAMAVPEPSGVALLWGTGLLMMYRRRKNARA